MAELHSEISHVDRELGSTVEEEIPQLTITMGHLGLVKSLEENEKVGCGCSCASCDMGRHCLSESRSCYL